MDIYEKPYENPNNMMTTDGELKQWQKDIMNDPVNHPSHYTDGKIEVISFIEDKKLGFHLGNAVKYISRAGKKDPAKTIEDLEKAIWYIQRHIDLLKTEAMAELPVKGYPTVPVKQKNCIVLDKN